MITAKNVESYKITQEARFDILSNELAQGKSFKEIQKEFSKKWNVSENTIRQYLADCTSYLSEKTNTDTLININIERLDTLFADCLKNGDTKNAITALDKLNRMLGAYKDRLNISTDDEIEVRFGF